MSLDCRIFRKKGEDQIYYYCRNSGVRPTEISLWTNPAEIPKEIEHRFKNCGTMIIGPYMAAVFGILEKLYPNFPRCNHPKYEDMDCIAEYCQFAPGRAPCKDWTKCPYFKQEPERNSNP